MKKKLLLCLFLFSFTTVLANDSVLIDFMFRNHEHFTDYAEYNVVFAKDSLLFIRPDQHYYEKLGVSTYESYIKHKKTLIKNYPELTESFMLSKKKITSNVSDTIAIKGLIQCLSLNYKDYKYTVDKSYHTLTSKTSISILNDFSNELISSLEMSDLPSGMKHNLLSYVLLPDTLAKRILEDTTSSLATKARISKDEQYLDSLINRFNVATSFAKKSKLICDILSVGEQYTFKYAIKIFNDSIFDINEDGCINSTIKLPIIKSFGRFYDTDIFNQRYHENFSNTYKLIRYKTSQSDYIKECIEWFEKEFNTSPDLPFKNTIPWIKANCRSI